jgi:hypothetical protein
MSTSAALATPGTAFRSPSYQLRWVLWVTLLALTPLLLSHPVDIHMVYQQVETTALLPDLLRFGILFMLWGTTVLTLVVTRSEEKGNNWSDLLLLNLFILVFWNFWNLATPLGGGIDSPNNNSIVRNLLDTGSIADPAPLNFLYLEFPGLHLLAVSLASVTGLDLLDATWALRLLFVHLYVTLAYTVLSAVLASKRVVLIGTLVLVVGALAPVGAAQSFAPIVLGTILLTLAWLFIVREEQRDTQTASRAAFMLVAGALIVSYFVNTMMLLGIVVTTWLLPGGRLLTRVWRHPRVGWGLGSAGVLFLAVSAGAWYLYWSQVLFSDTVTQFWRGFGFLYPTSSFESGALSVPPWATATRLTWLGFLGIGSCIALIRLLLPRGLVSRAELLTALALLGVAVVSVVAFAASPGGYQFHRFLVVAPLFVVPLALGWKPMLSQSWGRLVAFPRLTIVILVALLWATMLPSFLLAPRDIGSVTTYPSEIAISNFIRRQFGDGDNLQGYSIAFSQSSPVYTYGSPDATLLTDDPLQPIGQFWDNASSLVQGYLTAPMDSQARTFLWNDKAIALLRKQGIAPDDPNWSRLIVDLSTTSRVYANGLTVLYVR